VKAAHTLYRSEGFEETQPYEQSEIASEFWDHGVFMEAVRY
jgi:hypothetical protein